MYLREVRGRYERMPPVTEFPNVEGLNELMIVGPIRIRSACSHHLCPIMAGSRRAGPTSTQPDRPVRAARLAD
jgi:GTP cyclohydrolase I